MVGEREKQPKEKDMKKILFIMVVATILSGCNTPCGYWLKANFTFSVPNTYEKEVTRDGCRNETVKLKLEEHCWDDREVSSTLAGMEKQVYDEKLYVNKLLITGWRGDTAIVIFASNTPTLMKDKDELAEHKYHMVREEKCGCRLCK